MPFIYPFINLYSETTTENRYSTNLTYPDQKYTRIRRLVSRYEEVFLVGLVVDHVCAVATT